MAPIDPYWIDPRPGHPGTGHYVDPRTDKCYCDADCTVPYVEPKARKTPKTSSASRARR